MADRVKVSLGKTYNLGNYESLRLDVGIEVEVAPVVDHLKAFEYCDQWVHERLAELEKTHIKPRRCLTERRR